MELARSGDRAAFAVLFDRTLPQVWRRVSAGHGDTHAMTASRQIYLAAMRDLARFGDPGRFRPWLLTLAAPHAGEGTGSQVPDGIEDALWRDLERAWPDGELPRRRFSPPWGAIAAVFAAVLVAALLPVFLLGGPELLLGSEAPSPRQTVEASPADAAATPEAEITEFSFPTPPPRNEPQTTAPSVTSPAPRPSTSTVQPASSPTPAPTPRPTPTASPTPTPTPSASPSPRSSPSPSPSPTQDPGLPLPTPGGGSEPSETADA